MSECKATMEARGERLIPRQCPICKLGPCVEKVRNEHAAIKEIAGLIQRLSYRDMHKLAEIVAAEISADTGGPNAIAPALLKIADKILGNNAVAARSDMGD